MPNAARIGHELTEIRDDSPPFARFSLTIVIKKAHTCFRGISSKMNVPRKAAVGLILQLECSKQLLNIARRKQLHYRREALEITHWLGKIWQFAIGKITSQELLTDPDCVTESAKSVSTSRTSSHAHDGVINRRENPSTISSLVLLLGLISRFPMNELRVATNAQKRLRCSYDVQESVTMSKNALGIRYEPRTIFSNRGIRGQSFEQFKTFEPNSR